jgi:hypothetical protein
LRHDSREVNLRVSVKETLKTSGAQWPSES